MIYLTSCLATYEIACSIIQTFSSMSLLIVQVLRLKCALIRTVSVDSTAITRTSSIQQGFNLFMVRVPHFYLFIKFEACKWYMYITV